MKSTIEFCKDFYTEYGVPMIRSHFPEYEKRIAIGLVGEGSDCFGFDDEISRDHDFGIGFCMWLTNEDYDRIGPRLSLAYEELIRIKGASYSRKVWGTDYLSPNPNLSGRRGVQRISDFYCNTLRLKTDLDSLQEKKLWAYADPPLLFTVTNGQVFRDDYGLFSKIRGEILAFYPDRFYRARLADSLHRFSQAVQCNYPRMMARRDPVAARLCQDQAIRSALEITYLLNHSYMPYYKWSFRGLSGLSVLPEVSLLLKELALLVPDLSLWETIQYDPRIVYKEDPIINLTENLATLFAKEMNCQRLCKAQSGFLESCIPEIMNY